MANNIQNLVAAKVASGDTYAPRVSNPQPQSNPAPQNSFLPKTSGNSAAVQNAPQSVKAAVSAKIAKGDTYIRPSVSSPKSEPFTTPPSEAFQSTYDKAKDRSKFANSASEFAASSMSSFMGIVNWAANGLANGTRLGDQSTQWLRDFAKSTDASADKWEQKTAAYNAAATQDMGKVGTLIHDLAINALPMLADMGISALLVADDVTGVGVADDAVAAATAAKAASRGTKIWNAIKAFGVHADDVKQARQVVSSLSMAARVFGQEYNRNEDYMTHAQATLRAAISSAIEAATEKIFDFGLPGAAYGGGKTIEKVATEAAAKAFGKHEILAGLALSIAGEGAEEVLSDLGNALVDYQFEKAGIIGDYDELTWSGVAYDFLVGGLLGMLGTGENVVAVHEVNANQRLQQMKNAARQEARQAADDRLEKGTSVAEATEIFEEGGADAEASESPSEAQNGSTQQQTQTTPIESDTAQSQLLKTKPEELSYEQLLRASVRLESEGRFDEAKAVNDEIKRRQADMASQEPSSGVDNGAKIKVEETPSVADQIIDELVNNESTEDELMYMNEPYDPNNILHEYRGAEEWIDDYLAGDEAPYYSPATTPGEYASAEIFGRDGYLNFKTQLESNEKYIDPATGHLNEQGRKLLDDYLKNMTEKGRKDTAAKNRTDATEAADADYEEYMAQVPELEPDGSNYRDVFKNELDALWEYCEAVGLTEDEANNICNDYYHHQMTLKNAFRQARLTADAEYSNGEVGEVTDSHHEKTQHEDYREDFLDAEYNRRSEKDRIHDVDLESTWLPSAREAGAKPTIPDGVKNSTPDEYPNEIHDWDKFSESYLKRKLNEISTQGRELKAKVDNFAGLVDVPEGMGAGKMFRSDKAFREYANLQRELNELRLDYKYIKANLDARHKPDYVRSYTGEQISYDGDNVGFSEYEDAKRRNADNGIDVFADDFDENGGTDNGTRGITNQEVPQPERRRLRDRPWHRRRHNGGGGDEFSTRGAEPGAGEGDGRTRSSVLKKVRVGKGEARYVNPDTDNKGSIKFSPESAIVTTYNEAEQKIVDAAKDINAYLPHSKFSLMLALGRIFSGDYEVAGVNTNAYGNADGSRTIITNINDMVEAVQNIKHEFTHEVIRNFAMHRANTHGVDVDTTRENLVNVLYKNAVENRVLSNPDCRQARTQTLIKYYFKAKGYNLDRYDKAASEDTRAGYRKEAEKYYNENAKFRAKVNEEFLTNSAAGVFGDDIASTVRFILNDYMQIMFDESNIDKTGLSPQVPDFYSTIDSIDVSNYEVYDAPKWKPKDGYTKAVKWVDTDDELAKSFEMPANKWGESSKRIFEAGETAAYRVAEAASKGVFSPSALNSMRTTAEEAEVALNDYSSMIESFAIGDIGAVEFASYYRGLKDDDVNSMFYFENLARRLDALEEAQNEIYANGTPSFEDEDRFHRQAERAFRSIAHYTEAAMQGAEDAKAMSDSIKEHFGGGKDLKGFKKVLKKAVDVMGSYQLTPSTVFKMISGFSNSDNAVGYRYAKRVDAAVANRMATETEARSYFNEFKQRKGYYKWASGESKTGVIDAIGTEMTQLDAAHFIKNIDTLGGVTNSKVLDLDGFKIGDTFYEMSQFEGEDGDVVGNLSDMYNQVKSQLDEDSQAYLDSWFDAASYFAPRFQETSEAVEGNAKEVLDLDTYFPVYYANKDGTSIGWSPDVDGADSSPQGVQFTHSATTRSRNAGGYLDCGPITEAVDKYISSMSDYVAFAQLGQELQMMNRNTVFGDKASSAIGTGIDDSYARWFENYVGDVNKFTDDSAPDAINDALKRGRLAVQTGSLLFSMSVQMKQISSYWAAMAVLSPTVVVGSWRFKELTAKGNSRGNALADSRLLGADPSEYEVLNNKDGFLGKLKRKSKAFNDFANLTTIKDFRTVDNLFDATVMQVKMDNPGIDEYSAKFEQLVNDKFAEVLLRTQPIFVKQARAEYARTDNEFIRLTSMFRSQQTQNLNLIVTAIGEYTANKGTDLAGEKLTTLKNTLAGQATSVMSLSLLSVAADLLLHKIRKYDDDNDKEIDDSVVLTRIGLNAIESAAGTVAFGDAFAKYAIDLITQDTDEFKGFNLGALSTIKNSMDAVEELVKFPSFTNARVAAGYIAQSFGIPMNNAYAILNSAFMYTADLMGENPYGYDDMIRFLENQSQVSDDKKKSVDMTQEQVSEKIQELVADAKAHEAETGYYNGMKIMNYILELDTPTIDLDDAAESYLNEKQYAAYGAIRSAGYNPTETFDVFKEIDADHNTSLKQAEVFQYYLDNPVMEDIARAIWNSYGWKTSFDDYKKQNSK